MNVLQQIINFKPTGIKVDKGTFLVSEPLIADAIFRRSVLFLAEHGGGDESFGLIVNKPTDLKISEIADEFKNCDLPVYIGGPVDSNHLFFLHTIGFISGSYEVTDGVYWGGDLNEIKLMIHSGEINETNFRFFLGYSGWMKNQLETELKEESWLVLNSNKRDIFSEKPDNLWKDLILSFGNKYNNWLNIPINPQHN